MFHIKKKREKCSLFSLSLSHDVIKAGWNTEVVPFGGAGGAGGLVALSVCSTGHYVNHKTNCCYKLETDGGETKDFSTPWDFLFFILKYLPHGWTFFLVFFFFSSFYFVSLCLGIFI